MRISIKNRIYFKILYVKKMIALVVISAMLVLCLCSFFSKVYKPYITEIALSRANHLIQKLVNETVLELMEKESYGSFVTIIRDSEQRITGLETDAVKINKFKAAFLDKVSEKLSNVALQKYSVPLFSFLNNVFFAETGPYISIKVKPVSMINADLVNKFISVGVNQTKQQIDLKYNVNVVIVMPAMSVRHTISSELAIVQTIIVGQVPQSYTNITTEKENFEDTVLQLAGN